MSATHEPLPTTRVGAADGSPACRSCGATGLTEILALGEQPLANALRRPEELDQPEPRAPLDLAHCGQCSLFQLVDSVAPEVLFGDYLYFSSVVKALVDAARELTGRIVAERGLGPGSLAVELASNDGYLLQHYRDAGVPVLGIEPAQNIAEVAEGKGIPTRSVFFDQQVAEQMRAEGLRPDVVHANNVMAHVPDLNGFVGGISTLIGDHGMAVVEVAYVKQMLDGMHFDTIYHEHLCYYSLMAIERLFRRHGMAVEHVELIPLHGGSLRVFARGESVAEPDATVERFLAADAEWGADRPEPYLAFAARIRELEAELKSLLGGFKADGASIVAYGAAAKASTLLNTFGIGSELLDSVIDASPHKQGLHMPGSGLPIVPPARLLEDRPDYVLLLAWNLADEIMGQQREYIEAGGRFILPLPSPRVV